MRSLGYFLKIALQLELFTIEKVSFKRCIQPLRAINNPTLVMFSDASEQAFVYMLGENFQMTNISAYLLLQNIELPQ